MSEIQADIDRNRRHRASILRIVRRRPMEGVTWPGLESIFRKAGILGASGQLEENVVYLEAKGYLRTERKRDEISGVERWMLYITPQAIDLLDGVTEPDPGVDLVV